MIAKRFKIPFLMTGDKKRKILFEYLFINIIYQLTDQNKTVKQIANMTGSKTQVNLKLKIVFDKVCYQGFC